jgi:hypothetical protein
MQSAMQQTPHSQHTTLLTWLHQILQTLHRHHSSLRQALPAQQAAAVLVKESP